MEYTYTHNGSQWHMLAYGSRVGGGRLYQPSGGGPITFTIAKLPPGVSKIDVGLGLRALLGDSPLCAVLPFVRPPRPPMQAVVRPPRHTHETGEDPPRPRRRGRVMTSED